MIEYALFDHDGKVLFLYKESFLLDRDMHCYNVLLLLLVFIPYLCKIVEKITHYLDRKNLTLCKIVKKILRYPE